MRPAMVVMSLSAARGYNQGVTFSGSKHIWLPILLLPIGTQRQFIDGRKLTSLTNIPESIVMVTLLIFRMEASTLLEQVEAIY